MTSVSKANVQFREVLTLGEEAIAGGDLNAAASLAQIAARYAFPANVGLFGSHRLERLLVDIGSHIANSPQSDPPRARASSRNILHVLSYGRPIGGDSRLVWRWIQEDACNRHSIVITSQSDVVEQYEVPDVLRRSAERTGGFLKVLRAPASHPIEQARELRTLCHNMDFVILYVFPYDIVPVLALAHDCGFAKTIFVNLSDHTFWLGGSVAHSIVHLRNQPTDFLNKRRGLNPACASSILPIPLSCRRSPMNTANDAKKALGYSSDVTLLLTIATPFKYSSPGTITFLDLVMPVMAKYPEAVLLAVGPEFALEWKAAYHATNGRVIALGTRWDTDLFYSAADVYLDSVPFSSITSLLEAGSCRTPLLGYKITNGDLSLLGPGAPGLDQTMEVATDPDSYRQLLAKLITDPQFREASGLRVQSSILSLHTGERWRNAVRAVYSEADTIDERCCLIEKYDDNFEPSALALALGRLYPPFNVRRLIVNYLEVLPYRRRVFLTWRLYKKGFDLAYVNLLPWPANLLMRTIGRSIKRRTRGALWFVASHFQTARQQMRFNPHRVRTQNGLHNTMSPRVSADLSDSV